MIRTPLLRLRALLVAAALVGGSLGGLAAPAQAAPGTPTGLTPSGVSASGVPTLTWGRVPGATVYNVQVSTTASFASPFWSIDTVNRQAVPQWHLPKTDDGKIYWRVRAVDATAAGPWATTSFDRSALAGPAPTAPADGALLVQPRDPALLSWSAVDGAISYRVEIDTGDDFIGASTYDTQATSFVAPDPNVATTYHWRVTATLSNGAVTQPSTPRTYQLGGLAKPVLVGPENNADAPVPGGDVVLEWLPVAGAARYNLQVSTDINFPANTETRTVTGITGTRYSPPTTFGNDQFFWRVQPVDAANHQLDWDQVSVWTFQRDWPEQPVLQHPEDQSATVGQPGNDLFYQWTAVPHAAWYRLQLSTVSTFNSIYTYCDTKQTTYVPVGDDCRPAQNATVYWRVIAYDNDCSLSCSEMPHTDGIASNRGRFTYKPSMVDLSTISPAPGAVLPADQVPVLRWNAVDNTARYQVTVTNTATNAAVTVVTASLSYVPRDPLPAATYPATFRWQVRTLSESGQLGSALLDVSQPTFTLTGAYTPSTTPVAATATPESGVRMPLMTWSPVAGAAYYQVYVRLQGQAAEGWLALDGFFRYPAAAFEATQAGSFDLLGPETYEWMVKAYASNGSPVGDISTGSYEIVSPASVVGERVALTGTALSSDATSCTVALPAKCDDLRQSPVLRWSPVPGAGAYVVYISRDAKMTNILSQYTTTTQQNMWTFRELLPDSNAGGAYYWTVKPCVTGQACAGLEYAQHAFNKLSNAVELASPVTADGGTPVVRADIVTMRWNDYLATNSAATAAHLDATSVPARQEAARYQVQVSTTPNFEPQGQVDEQYVDQTTYTAYDRTYPEGPLYWRVRAWDGTGNPLAWSVPGYFVKTSDHPRLLSPTDGAGAGVVQPFRWEPMSYASSYDIEVYSGIDTIGQAAGRVITGNSKQVAFATTVALAPGYYSWRVRRVDSGGKVGPWSPLNPADLSAGEKRGLTQVTTSTPVPTAPAADAIVPANEGLFAWESVSGASAYIWQRREATSGTVYTSVSTRALAWAPNDLLQAGAWQWSVQAIDVNGKVLGQSPWRGFTVGSATGGTGTGGTGGTGTGGTGTGGTGTGGTGTGGTGGSGATGGTGTGSSGTSLDSTKPQVKSFKPGSGSKVKRTSSFTVAFTEPVTGVTAASLQLTLNGTKVKATVALSQDGRVAILKPKSKLKAKKRYVLKATQGIRDVAGNALVAKSATYKTKS